MTDSMRITCAKASHGIVDAIFIIRECISLLEIEAKNSEGKELETKMTALADLQIANENLRVAAYWTKKAMKLKS